MADVELVIRIPEGLKNDFEMEQWTALSCMEIKDVLMNGTPLPKGHGRLIDSGDIQFENDDFDTYGDYCIAFDEINRADTIVEADEESEGE